jgi:uncharacterized membrane protein YjgN (DUF898 family)
LSNDSGAVPATESAQLKAHSTPYQVEFRGSGGEYFKIWIVNVLLIIVTLTIYAAWAKVRTKRYFYGNTVVDNTSFEYHAKPLQILYGQLIAYAALIIVTLSQRVHVGVWIVLTIILVLLIPWVIWRSLKFNARMSSYRNVRFGFSGSWKRIYAILILIPLLILAVVTAVIFGVSLLDNREVIALVSLMTAFLLYSLYPVFHQMLAFYSHNFHRYGTAKFSAPLRKRDFIWIYVKTVLLAILILAAFFIVFGIFAFIANLVATGLFDKLDIRNLDANDLLTTISAGFIGVVFYLIFLFLGAIVTAYFRSRIRNYRYDFTSIGDRVELRSIASTKSLAVLMITNLLLLVFTIGLAYPWVKVRNARYFAKHTQILSTGQLDQFAADEKEKVTALGAELGDAFDLDMDIGI